MLPPEKLLEPWPSSSPRAVPDKSAEGDQIDGVVSLKPGSQGPCHVILSIMMNSKLWFVVRYDYDS